MIRYILALALFLFISCSKESSPLLVDETYTVSSDDSSAHQELHFYAMEAAKLKSIQEAKENAGYAPFAPLKREHHPNLNDDEWANYCSDLLFKSLGFPFNETNGSSFQVIDKHTYTIKHTAEALAKFEQLIDRVKLLQEQAKSDYTYILPDNPDGEFYSSLRKPPNRKVMIDLRNPSDTSGLPKDVEWFPMGDMTFCAIQGTTDLHLTLPSGQIIHEEFSIVYVDKDDEGIFNVRAHSLGWLKIPAAIQRLDREISFLTKLGSDKAYLSKRSTAILQWIESYDHNSNMYEGLGFKSDKIRFNFSFQVNHPTKLGIRYRYHAETPRSKSRIQRNWENRNNKTDSQIQQ